MLSYLELQAQIGKLVFKVFEAGFKRLFWQETTSNRSLCSKLGDWNRLVTWTDLHGFIETTLTDWPWGDKFYVYYYKNIPKCGNLDLDSSGHLYILEKVKGLATMFKWLAEKPSTSSTKPILNELWLRFHKEDDTKCLISKMEIQSLDIQWKEIV